MTTDPAPAEPAADAVPARRRRRSHPAFLAFAAIGVSATAVMTGASVSASTMPDAPPSSADVITLGTFDGADGYECAFTGEEAKALESRILSSDATERVRTTVPLPAGAGGGAGFGAGVEASAEAVAGEDGSVTVSGPAVGGPTGAGPSFEGPTTHVDGAAPVPAGEPIEITALPVVGADGSTGPGPAIRAGTDAECDALVAEATDAQR